MRERMKCEQCGAEFEEAQALTDHVEREHGSDPSAFEQKMADRTGDPEARCRTQVDQLAGLGDIEDPPAEDESLDRLDREVHRPPAPGSDRVP